MINHTNTKSNTDLKDSIVKVIGSKNNFYGFAFFIYNRYCVTCHHCICKIEDEIYIQKDNKKYPVTWVEEYSDASKNVTILRIDNSITATATTGTISNFKPFGCAEKEALTSTSTYSFLSYAITLLLVILRIF